MGKALKGLFTIDCACNNLSLNCDSDTENTTFLQIFTKNSAERKHGELTANASFLLVLFLI